MPQTTKITPKRRPPSTKPVAPKVHDAELVDELDALLDEIDRALEENALETVRLYRQRGSPMSCTVCSDPKVVAKGRCMTCWKFHKRNGHDRTERHVIRLTERDIERELMRRKG